MGTPSLRRDEYVLGIFFLTLDLALNIFVGMVYLQADSAVKYLSSFSSWFIACNLVGYAAMFFLIKYYLLKNYRATAISALVFVLTCSAYALVVYFMVTAQRLEGYFTTVYGATSFTLFLYGLSLVARPKKGKWLQVAGGLALLFGFGLGLGLLVRLNTVDFGTKLLLAQVETALFVAASLLPLPFILNFNNELRALEPQKNTGSFGLATKAVMLATLVIALILSIRLASDCVSNNLRSRTPSERQKLLAAPFEARVFTADNGQKLGYRLLRPVNYDPEKSYPLAVCLHHGGGTGTENIVQVATSEFAQTLSEPGNRKKYPSFIFVPQCPPGSSFGGIPNYPKIDELVVGAITELEKEFKIDRSRRYVMGVSLGGFGAWHLIGSRPEMFAAAIPVCGGGNPDHGKDMAQVGIWAFHGEADSNVPAKLSRDMIHSVRRAGGNPKYTEFQGIGHHIWPHVMRTPGKLEWLFAQKKEGPTTGLP
ncbi:hypothetical protein [Pseudozobellia thermophila]|uniref:Alpha/beta hydrolase family protein n=1 Tax=Pseudozobellia thermophila TaxID=192903 RepID=A0A1M6MKW9_9FLAO|nr:hypothetical protein [Pseudozobellia thermophila]SHJ84064.1 hypothetical protein SAMN04488513_11036 [Pseudozobellia thermophila]